MDGGNCVVDDVVDEDTDVDDGNVECDGDCYGNGVGDVCSGGDCGGGGGCGDYDNDDVVIVLLMLLRMIMTMIMAQGPG